MSLSNEIETAMRDSLDLMNGCLKVVEETSSTHKVISITGWDSSEESHRAIARYLVGIRASAIDAALTIRARLAGTDEERAEVQQSVFQLVGAEEGQLGDNEIRTERNAWMAEGIWHMCMVAASEKHELHPSGTVIAVDNLHMFAKDHGLDVSAIYLEDGVCGLAFVETKAYRTNTQAAIGAAVNFFRSVDRGEHGSRIRQAVQVIRGLLHEDLQPFVTESFWHQEREYIPNPHYDSGQNVNWKNRRRSFRNLAADKDHVLIMPHPIDDFLDFFDSIANEMRDFANEL